MSKSSKIRVLALGLIQNRDEQRRSQGHQIFVSQGYDTSKQKTFYRALGGGIDFGESSLDALKREFKEEIQAELTNIDYLGCLENIFVYENNIQHELIQLYSCDFVDLKFYELEELKFMEKKRKKKALWVPIKLFKSGELILFPEQFLQYC